MKHNRVTAFLCSILCAAACLPLDAAAAEPRIHLHAADSITPRVSAEAPVYDVPAAFDLRQKGLVSAVKDQTPYGTCWVFATMSSLESRCIAKDPHVDFSEWYMAHYSAMGPMERPEETPYMDVGGTPSMISSLMMNWIGPVSEEKYPYNGDLPDFTKSFETLRREAELHVTDFHYFALDGNYAGEESFRKEMRQQLKQAIYEGNVLYFDIPEALFTLEEIYNEETASYYEPQDFMITYVPAEDEEIQGHAMSLVGWDDNYPASNFATKPAQNGAWLVKNSWGLGQHDHGYFWLSYDQMMGCAVYYDVEDAARKDTMFSHDDFGCAGAFYITDQDTEAYAANVFTAEEDTWLTEAMVNCFAMDDTCEITVYTGLTEESPVSGTASAPSEKKLTHYGYQTIQLAEPVFVRKGERFSVVAKFTGYPGAHIPCEMAVADRSKGVGATPAHGGGNMLSQYREQIEKDYNAGESFYSADGASWNDVYEERLSKDEIGDEFLIGNICLKAIGVKAGKVEFSEYHETLPLGTEIVLSTPEDADIYYAVNDGEYALYEQPIPFSGDMKISAYADTGEKTVYTQSYTQQKAELSSLLFENLTDKYYLDLNQAEQAPFSYMTSPGRSYLMPISTGKITINGEECVSGTKYMLDMQQKEQTLTIEVTQDGMLPTSYKIKLVPGVDSPVPNGVYNMTDYGDDQNSRIYECIDGKGLCKKLKSGDTEEFSYELTPEGKLRFVFADHTEEYDYSAYGDIVSVSFSLYDGNEAVGYGSLYSDRCLEACALYSDPEILQYVKEYYAYEFGKPDVRTEFDDDIVRVYEGKECIASYNVSHYGNMFQFDEDNPMMADEMFYRTAVGDVDGDQTINASDAAQILIEAATVGSGQDGTFGYVKHTAGDVNGDGTINASDAAVVLIYAAAVGAGDTMVKLSSFVR